MKDLSVFFFVLKSFLSELSNFPLVIASISAMLYFGFSFKLLILLILGIGIAMFGSRLTSLNYEFRLLKQLNNYVDKYADFNFSDFTLDEFMRKMYQEKFDPSEMTKKHREAYFRLLIPSTNLRLRRIKLVFIHDVDTVMAPLPNALVTFNFVAEPWIFVAAHPSKMNGIQKFQLLHEIGHARLFGNTEIILPSKVYGFLLGFLCTSIILYNSGYFLTFLFASLVMAVLLLILHSSFIRSSEIIDEINADCFAFERALTIWFAKYHNDYDFLTIARKVCSVAEKETKPGLISKVFDKLDVLRKYFGSLNSEKKEAPTTYRIKLFAENLERLKNGQDSMYRYPPKILFLIKSLNYVNVVVFGFWVFSGLTFEKVTVVQLLILGVLFLFIVLLANIVHYVSRVLLLNLGDSIKVSKLSADEKDVILGASEIITRIRNVRSKFTKRKRPPENI